MSKRKQRRAEARRQGQKTYAGAKLQCGHGSLRYVSNNRCVLCNREYARKYYETRPAEKALKREKDKKRLKTVAHRTKKNEARNLKRATDADYRDRENARDRARWAKNKVKRCAAVRNRYATDPVFAAKMRANAKVQHAKKRARMEAERWSAPRWVAV